MSFRVTKTWLTQNKLESADVSLYRYKDDAWNELSTKVISTDATYVNYEAVTPGFSYFAIGAKAVPAAEVPGKAFASLFPKTPE